MTKHVETIGDRWVKLPEEFSDDTFADFDEWFECYVADVAPAISAAERDALRGSLYRMMPRPEPTLAGVFLHEPVIVDAPFVAAVIAHPLPEPGKEDGYLADLAGAFDEDVSRMPSVDHYRVDEEISVCRVIATHDVSPTDEVVRASFATVGGATVLSAHAVYGDGRVIMETLDDLQDLIATFARGFLDLDREALGSADS